jgi:membrane protein
MPTRSRPVEPPPKRSVVELGKRTLKEWWTDDAPRHAAALAFYSALSIAPVLLIAISVAGLVFGREAAEGRIVEELRAVLGASTAQTVQSMVDSANKPAVGIVATIIGIGVLLFGASGVFAELQASLDRIWEVKAKPRNGVLAFLRTRLLSLSMVFGVAFLLLVSLLLSTALAAFADSYHRLVPVPVIWQAINFIVSLVVVAVLFAMLFKFLPDARVAWKDVWVGAAATSLLFALGKLGIAQYIGRADVESSHGAAGSVVVALVWVYYSAQILFLGAELTQVYAHLYGSRIAPVEGGASDEDEGDDDDAEKPRRREPEVTGSFAASVG